MTSREEAIAPGVRALAGELMARTRWPADRLAAHQRVARRWPAPSVPPRQNSN